MQYAKDIARVALILLIAYLLVAGLTGCKRQQTFSIEQVPQEYRTCARRVMPTLPDRRITQQELIIAYAKLKRYAGTTDRCYKGLIRWADAQYEAYYQQY